MCSGERVWQAAASTRIPHLSQLSLSDLGSGHHGLSLTKSGNRYAIVFQDFLSKWPFIFTAPDQKATRLAHLLTKEIILVFGVPDALLSNRGTNFLSLIMRDVCELLGTTKLNTTAHQPQYNGMVEWMNRMLKAMLRKHTAKFGKQWDQCLPGVLWAYQNTPNDSTLEKPSFLLFGVDLRSPIEAALLPPHDLEGANLSDFREELMLSLSSACEHAVSSVREAQKRYKKQYDKKSRTVPLRCGDWALVCFHIRKAEKALQAVAWSLVCHRNHS